MQGNLGVHAEPEKSMYHFYLQLEGQPAQLSQEEDCLKRVNCSRIVWCIWTNRKKRASDLFRGVRSEYQYLSWHPGVFSGSPDEGYVWGWFLRNRMSEKKWPILGNLKDQLSKQRPGKAIALHVFCAWYPGSCPGSLVARGQARLFGVAVSNPPGSVSTSLSDSSVSVSLIHVWGVITPA